MITTGIKYASFKRNFFKSDFFNLYPSELEVDKLVFSEYSEKQ